MEAGCAMTRRTRHAVSRSGLDGCVKLYRGILAAHESNSAILACLGGPIQMQPTTRLGSTRPQRSARQMAWLKTGGICLQPETCNSFKLETSLGLGGWSYRGVGMKTGWGCRLHPPARPARPPSGPPGCRSQGLSLAGYVGLKYSLCFFVQLEFRFRV